MLSELSPEGKQGIDRKRQVLVDGNTSEKEEKKGCPRRREHQEKRHRDAKAKSKLETGKLPCLWNIGRF